MPLKIIHLLCVLVLFGFYGCTVEKRLYTKGWCSSRSSQPKHEQNTVSQQVFAGKVSVADVQDVTQIIPDSAPAPSGESLVKKIASYTDSLPVYAERRHELIAEAPANEAPKMHKRWSNTAKSAVVINYFAIGGLLVYFSAKAAAVSAGVLAGFGVLMLVLLLLIVLCVLLSVRTEEDLYKKAGRGPIPPLSETQKLEKKRRTSAFLRILAIAAIVIATVLICFALWNILLFAGIILLDALFIGTMVIDDNVRPPVHLWLPPENLTVGEPERVSHENTTGSPAEVLAETSGKQLRNARNAAIFIAIIGSVLVAIVALPF